MAKKGKKGNPKSSGGQEKKETLSGPNMDDERFKQVLTDPRFKTMKQSDKKVKIDNRFKGMFTEKRFTVKHTMDKRGRPVEQMADENLKQFYQLSDNEDEGEKEDSGVDDEEPGPSKSKELETVFKRPKLPDPRGLNCDSEESSSSDESSDEDEEEDDDDVEHPWGELDRGVERSEDTFRRLAVCNVDWDRLKAMDLFVLFNSFKPENSMIKSVKIYKSDFGKKRLAEEEVNGPTEIVQTPIIHDEGDGTQHVEGSDTHDYMTERLRQYQLNRLKYFYAVVECDDPKTATVLYDELDHFEYESSAFALDVRFIPDNVEFDEENLHQECLTLPELFFVQSAPFCHNCSPTE